MEQATNSAAVRRFWLDDGDALERIDQSDVSEHIRTVARSLCVDGIAVIRRANAAETCRRVIVDYGRYVDQHREYVRGQLTPEGREKRLVNFHLWSEAAAQIGTNPLVMDALDFIFGGRTAVYTSLTFKYGTQQPVHRDTPHFATWPLKMFAGAWTALEDVASSAGPLFYHRGAHRLQIDPTIFMHEARGRIPEAPARDQLLMALDLYNGEVIRRSPEVAPAELLEMQAGDTVIWHPEMPHGGSPATDPGRTRWSTVFHCAPMDVQVHQHDRFFTHSLADGVPPDRYGYFERMDRPIAVSGDVGYM